MNPYLYDVPVEPADAKIILVPVPFDATTSYRRGTALGPEAIRRASVQVDLFDLELHDKIGEPAKAGIALLQQQPEVFAWNQEARSLVDKVRDAEAETPAVAEALNRVNEIGSQINDWVYRCCRDWLHRGRIVGVIGGDHSVPFGNIRAHLEKYSDVGILHIDAHADLRAAYQGFHWSHASILHNVMERLGAPRLVQVAIRDFCREEWDYIENSPNITTWFDRHLSAERTQGTPENTTMQRIVDDLPQNVYVTLDIDGLDPALCPHTGTPVPGGLSIHSLFNLLRTVTESGRQIVGFDLVEVAPHPTFPKADCDEWDANVGARVLYKLCGHALLNR